MVEQTYTFTRSQLTKLLHETISMYRELKGDRLAAVHEMLDGLDADRELVAHDPTERLRLQLPPIVGQADASAESFEANSKALS